MSGLARAQSAASYAFSAGRSFRSEVLPRVNLRLEWANRRFVRADRLQVLHEWLGPRPIRGFVRVQRRQVVQIGSPPTCEPSPGVGEPALCPRRSIAGTS